MIRLCGRLRGTHQLNDRFACKQPRLTKIVFNLLERYILRKKSSSLQVRESSLKEELLQQNTSSYEILLLMTLSFLSSPPPPSPPACEPSSAGFLTGERGNGVRGVTFFSLPADRGPIPSFGHCRLATERLIVFPSFLKTLLPGGGAGTGLPFASPFQTCVRFSDSPQPKPWAPLEAASLDSVAQTQP